MRKFAMMAVLALASFSNVYADEEEIAIVDETIVSGGDENPADPSLLFDCGCGKGKGGKPKA